MSDKQRAIDAAVAAGFAPHDDHLRRMAKHGGVDVVEVFEHMGKALIMLNVPLSEVPAVVKPLTLAEVERAVRAAFDPDNPDTPIIACDDVVDAVVAVVLARLKDVPR